MRKRLTPCPLRKFAPVWSAILEPQVADAYIYYCRTKLCVCGLILRYVVYYCGMLFITAVCGLLLHGHGCACGWQFGLNACVHVLKTCMYSKVCMHCHAHVSTCASTPFCMFLHRIMYGKYIVRFHIHVHIHIRVCSTPVCMHYRVYVRARDYACVDGCVDGESRRQFILIGTCACNVHLPDLGAEALSSF